MEQKEHTSQNMVHILSFISAEYSMRNRINIDPNRNSYNVYVDDVVFILRNKDSNTQTIEDTLVQNTRISRRTDQSQSETRTHGQFQGVKSFRAKCLEMFA